MSSVVSDNGDVCAEDHSVTEEISCDDTTGQSSVNDTAGSCADKFVKSTSDDSVDKVFSPSTGMVGKDAAAGDSIADSLVFSDESDNNNSSHPAKLQSNNLHGDSCEQGSGVDQDTSTSPAQHIRSVGSSDIQELSEEVHKTLLRQLEYYFSDFNLPRDRFMQSQISNNNGWLPINVLMTFKRISRLGVTPAQIMRCLVGSQLVEVDTEGERLRRYPACPAPELTDERKQNLQSRTLYIKGIPQQESLDDILKFCARLSDFENVHLRRYKDGKTGEFLFKGSVFVTFCTEKGASDVISECDTLYYNEQTKDSPLIVKWQKKYFEEKKSPNSVSDKKKGIDNSIIGKKSESKSSICLTNSVPGNVLHLNGIDKCGSWKVLSEAFDGLGYKDSIRFIDFENGDADAYIRFKTPEIVAEIVSKHAKEGTLSIMDQVLKVRVLEGEEEKEYLVKQEKSMQLRANASRGRPKRKKTFYGTKSGKKFRGS